MSLQKLNRQLLVFLLVVVIAIALLLYSLGLGAKSIPSPTPKPSPKPLVALFVSDTTEEIIVFSIPSNMTASGLYAPPFYIGAAMDVQDGALFIEPIGTVNQGDELTYYGLVYGKILSVTVDDEQKRAELVIEWYRDPR